MSVSRSPVLRSTWLPEQISRIQAEYFTSFEAQLLATLAIVVGVALSIAGTRQLKSALRNRYGSAIVEASSVASLVVVVIGGVYALSVVWHVNIVFRRTAGSMTISRWTAAQQLLTVAVIVVAYLSIRFINRSIDTLAETDAITVHQSEMAYHVADLVIAVVAGTLLLTLWGVDLTNIFISAGAIAAIATVAARETLSAMIAGFVLLFSRPFRVGDWIAANDRTGIVTDVTIFNTKIQTFGDEHVLIPNDEITSSQLTNFSRNDQLRVDVEVGVDYDTDLERAREVVGDAVADLDEIKNAPNPQVVAVEFGDSAIVLEARVWIGDPTRRRELDAKTAVIESIKEAFEREGIEIPLPQRVHASRDESGIPISAGEVERARFSGTND